jgi:hypothetical protein
MWQAIRDHWHIENRSHYVRDGSFAEDASRIRCNPGIFARLRSFAANILRFNGIHNVSDGRHRIAFGGISAILAMRVMYRASNSPGSTTPRRLVIDSTLNPRSPNRLHVNSK